MEFTRSTLRLVVDGRSVTVRGEAYLPGYGSPDFVVYTNTINCWDDGEVISEESMKKILKQIAEEAELRGIRVKIE